jgi:hypothetical protein
MKGQPPMGLAQMFEPGPNKTQAHLILETQTHTPSFYSYFIKSIILFIL